MNRAHCLMFAAAAVAGVSIGASLARRRFEWSGKVVLITGGSRGLGLNIARQLALRGARVAICARDVEELQRAEHDIRGYGPDVHAFPCDLNVPAEIRRMVREVEERLGPVDVLFNNAGVITMGPVQEMTLEDFEEAMRIYFWAPLHTINAVLPHMRDRGFGQIVNISSIGGKVPVPHLTPYCAAKFALTGLSGCLRAELAQSGIGVTTICPFVMRTGSQLNARLKGRHRAEFAWFMLAGSSAPFSIPVERAAARVIRAAERKEAEVMLGVEAKLGARLYGAAPSLTGGIMGLIARALPQPGGIGQGYQRGLESRTRAAMAFPTRPIYKAALQNNQVTGERRRVVEEIIAPERPRKRTAVPVDVPNPI
jgi:NAD(P)-dependent dehydrogenase (short-subunit alcohol dehydrogenase family)